MSLLLSGIQRENLLLALGSGNPKTNFDMFRNKLFVWNIFSRREIEGSPEVNKEDLLKEVLISLKDWIKSEIA